MDVSGRIIVYLRRDAVEGILRMWAAQSGVVEDGQAVELRWGYGIEAVTEGDAAAPVVGVAICEPEGE